MEKQKKHFFDFCFKHVLHLSHVQRCVFFRMQLRNFQSVSIRVFFMFRHIFAIRIEIGMKQGKIKSVDRFQWNLLIMFELFYIIDFIGASISECQ